MHGISKLFATFSPKGSHSLLTTNRTEGVCVDIHVHRVHTALSLSSADADLVFLIQISNRLGWVNNTKKPEATRKVPIPA